MQAQKQKTTTGSKRKNEDEHDRSHSKRVKRENLYAVGRLQIKHRAPKGVRKSNRIAGRPADPLDPWPRGQYNRNETNSGVPAGPDSDLRSASAEDTPPEITQRGSVSTGEDVEASRSRARSFLEVLVSTLSSHKIIRRLVDGHNRLVDRADSLEYGRNGVIDLKDQLEDEKMDADGTKEDLTRLRDGYDAKLQMLKECERALRSLEAPIQDLRVKHADHNNQLYDYLDVSQGEAELQCLPTEFWTAYRRCYEAYTRCRDFELEMHEAEQEQRKLFQEVETRMVDSVCQKPVAVGQGADTPQIAAFDDPMAIANARVSALDGYSATLNRLNRSLKDAKATQYKEEARLHEIAEDAFIAAGFLHAETDIDKSKLRWRLWNGSDIEEGPHLESRDTVNVPTRPTARPRPGRLLFDVKAARRWLKHCSRRIDDSRWAPVSNVGSLNSTGQGEARFRRMKRLTQEVRDAELEYRSVLRRAQNARAISESDQSSNFRDHESDGYSDATLRMFGYPMHARRKHRVHKWIDDMLQSGKGQQARVARQGSDSSTEGSWINRVQSMVYGEDIELVACERRKDRIDAWDKEQQRLRQEGPFEQAENDFHPQNRV